MSSFFYLPQILQIAQIFLTQSSANWHNLREINYSSMVLKVRFTRGVFTFVVGGSLWSQ